MKNLLSPLYYVIPEIIFVYIQGFHFKVKSFVKRIFHLFFLLFL